MKTITFASGKGGAGKTTISLSFHTYISEKSLYADCDVDASDGFLLLEKKILHQEKFHSGFSYEIDTTLCRKCGRCIRNCEFDAIDSSFEINNFKCEGCGRCEVHCGFGAITKTENYCGDIFYSETNTNSQMVYAKLFPGEDNSGKLVHKVRVMAKKTAEDNNFEYVVIDSPPGIGCAPIASLTGVDYLVLVTETSLSGFSDAKRLVELAEKMKIKIIAILNKTELNKDIDQIVYDYYKKKNIPVAGSIPFDSRVVDSLNKKQILIKSEYEDIRENIERIMSNIVSNIN